MSRSVVEAPPARALSARSVVLSLLLGAPSHGLPARDVVALTAAFEVSQTATRAALSRLVAAGDLVVDTGTYRLAARHRRRQESQEAALRPATRRFDGSWRLVVVAAGARGAADRAHLRDRLVDARLAELRDGVWTRPDNLAVEDRTLTRADVVTMAARPDDPVGLAARLWDLDAWARQARALLRRTERDVSLRARFADHAAVVRHLRRDPHLPAALLPADWPAAELRDAYATFRAELIALRPHPDPHPDPEVLP